MHLDYDNVFSPSFSNLRRPISLAWSLTKSMHLKLVSSVGSSKESLLCVPVLYFWINVPILRPSHGDQCSSLSVYRTPWQVLSLTWLVGVFNSQRPRNIVSTKNRKNESIFCRLGCRRCHWLHYKSKLKWVRGRRCRALCGMKDHFSDVEFDGKCRIQSTHTRFLRGVCRCWWELLDVEMDGAVGVLEEMMEAFESKPAGCWPKYWLEIRMKLET